MSQAPGNRPDPKPRGIPCDRCTGTRWRLADVCQLTNGTIRRRRECRCCGARITTYERPARQPAR